MKSTITLIFCTFFCVNLFSQLKTGDPGVTFNQSLININQSCYPQMKRWSEAGVNGGIPFLTDFNREATINPGNSSSINLAINNMANSLTGNQKGIITLQNGTYNINARINMKSNVSLRGQSRDGVRCIINMNGGDAFYFSNISYSGIYNLTIEGGWGTPTYNWNYGISANDELPNNDNVSIKMRGKAENCWLDKVTILNSAKDPLRINAKHNTLRDLYVDGAHRKAGGAQAYFFILNSDNLITGCYVTHLRHISLQGDNVRYNVLYDNNFDQEVSFHSGDDGNNLIAKNRITLPVDMPPVAPGDANSTTPSEARTNRPIYFAIMGPWSNQHQVSSNPNFLINNDCRQFNHNFGPQNPWSQSNAVYTGPREIGNNSNEHINNFPLVSGGCRFPEGGTLYPIQLEVETSQSPYGGNNASIPGTIQAENYDLGGQGIAYNDGNTGNSGGLFRNDGVDITNSKDVGGGYTIGWVSNGEWQEHTVNVDSGDYKIEARLASAVGNLGDLKLELSGANLGTFSPQNTGGWQSYQTYTLNNVRISGGNNRILKLSAINGGLFNINWVRFTKLNSEKVVTLRKSNAPNFALDGNHGASNNQSIKLWSYNADNVNQQWIEINRGGGFYSYKKNNTNHCIDASSGGANGNDVKLLDCNSNNQNQHFRKINLNGSFRLQKRNAPGFSIDGNSSASNGVNVHMWSSSNTNNNQKWIITQVGTRNKTPSNFNSKEIKEKIIITPNPASENITIQLTNGVNQGVLSIFDMSGNNTYKKQITDNRSTINISSLEKGLYIVQIKTKNKIIQTKLAIK